MAVLSSLFCIDPSATSPHMVNGHVNTSQIPQSQPLLQPRHSDSGCIDDCRPLWRRNRLDGQPRKKRVQRSTESGRGRERVCVCVCV